MKPTMSAIQVGEAMLGAKHVKMDYDRSKFMAVMTMLEMRGMLVSSEVTESFHFKVIKQRLKSDSPETIVSDHVIAVFSIMCDRVGAAVMYAAAIHTIFKKVGKPLTIKEVFTNYFQWGFLPEEELDRIWGMQKIGGANSLDTAEAWDEVSALSG